MIKEWLFSFEDNWHIYVFGNFTGALSIYLGIKLYEFWSGNIIGIL